MVVVVLLVVVSVVDIMSMDVMFVWNVGDMGVSNLAGRISENIHSPFSHFV